MSKTMNNANGVKNSSSLANNRVMTTEVFNAIKINAKVYAIEASEGCRGKKKETEYTNRYNSMLAYWFTDFAECSDEEWNNRLEYLKAYMDYSDVKAA